MFPLGLRAKGVSIGYVKDSPFVQNVLCQVYFVSCDSASSNWLNNFAVAISTPDFVAAAPYGAYIFLGSICVFGAFYVHFGVPETKARTLEEIDEVFGDQSGQSRLEVEMLQQAQRDVGLLALAGIELQQDNGSDSEKHSVHGKQKA